MGAETTTDWVEIEAEDVVRVGRVLGHVPGVSICSPAESDLVRHHLVQRIVRAYDEHDRGPEQSVEPTDGEDGDPK